MFGLPRRLSREKTDQGAWGALKGTSKQPSTPTCNLCFFSCLFLETLVLSEVSRSLKIPEDVE